MTSSSSTLKAKLANLSSSLGQLECMLDPLLSQSLPEAITGLEPLQQAKLQTAMPYIVYDLIFIYLKMKGTDPKTHPVVSELERVRQYFDKVKDAESPPTRRIELDKDAAGRFIKNAITQASANSTTALQTMATEQRASVPAKVTTKMIARAQYERALQRDSHNQSEADDGLEVYDEPGSTSSTDTEDQSQTSTIQPALRSVSVVNSSKRRRPPMDPFAGYSESAPDPEESVPKRNRSSPQPDHSKSLGHLDDTQSLASLSGGINTNSSANHRDLQNSATTGSITRKHKKKKAKKIRR